jgi:hypothetical protein
MSISGFITPTRFSPIFRSLAAFVALSFLFEILAIDILHYKSSEVFAQVNTAPNLVMPSSAFLPPTLKAIHLDPESPLDISFIIDSADQGDVDQNEVNKLVEYFLAAMATPEKDMWVNLSPYESKRIIAPQFGETSAGRELLAQDQLLKQLAASFTYPESMTGKEFWSRVYQKAIAMYGTTAVPIDTFQRVWIMPGKAVVYEHNGTAFISESHLKVLLEDDYEALRRSPDAKNGPQQKLSESEAKKVNNFSATITREVVLPAIEKEINEGKNFAALRQVFHAIILAAWFKKKLKQHILAQVYVDRKKVKGIEDDSERTAEKIYQQYVQVLKDGVYNYVRGDYDAPSQSVISRQYFSGGFSMGNPEEWLDIRPISNILISSVEFLKRLGRKLLLAKIRLRPLGLTGALPLPLAFVNAPQGQAAVNTAAVLTASLRELQGGELVRFYFDKFRKAIAGQAHSSLLAFLEVPASVIQSDDILQKTGDIKQTPVYLLDAGKINIITDGKVGEEVSSSAVVAGGLVLIVLGQETAKIRYRDAAVVEKKTGLSRNDQLAKYISSTPVVAVGGPDKDNPGGIDMQAENILDVRGESHFSAGPATIPEVFLRDMQGMDFKILELTPMINMPQFMPDFVLDHGTAPQQQLSLTVPSVDVA